MHKFVDEVSIRIKAGNGGPGAVAFRHEKYAEFGGPDGGDGGDGGNVYFVVDPSVVNLAHIRYDRIYQAENGHNGMGQNKHGAGGNDLYVKVPLGCQLIEPESTEIIHDFLDQEPFLAARGGRGGKGNTFFKTSTRQSPRFSQPGEEGEAGEYTLSLKLIADVGLVGFPNAGKSTLLRALTQANPKIANYPFTTLSPNLGVLQLNIYEHILIADIPGILEGASQGHGLGLSFLKHIERVKIIIFVLDATTTHVEEELKILRNELDSYNPALNQRPFLVVFNKVDLLREENFEEDFIAEWMQSFHRQGIEPLAISAQTGEGIEELRAAIEKLLHPV